MEKRETTPCALPEPPFAGCRKCGAKTRRGTPCQAPAMKNGRCRMHGGKSPGAPKGNRNAWKHGMYGRETKAVRRLLKSISKRD